MQKIENKSLRINFTGVSGIGKTTIAKIISQKLGIPFISGSYSDLVPSTKDQKHSKMITKDPEEIFRQDSQVLNLRNKLFRENETYVSDRSYMDSAAYLIQKLAHRIKECDTDSFIDVCKALTMVQVSHLIYIPFTDKMLKTWEMEDNGKRVLNRYYQWEVSRILDGIIDLWDYKSCYISENYDSGYFTMESQGKTFVTQVLILYTDNLELREKIILEWINQTSI